ncbi:MAG: CoA transferase [Dehalococcoidia bacterium]|nr:CoA transferase [Dehalococcoidia bacterium]
MAQQALSDMKVIDLTHYIAGPACTKLLADYGADVIKIEPPGVGDGARNMGPFYKDDPHPEKSGLFMYLNTNKRGITLNLKSAMGKGIFKEMVKRADVVVENFKPGVMERLGLSYADIETINPKLVMTSISNFGQTGPYRDYKLTELMAFGMGGPMHSKGDPEREPLKYGLTVSIYHSGIVAATATMIAFYGSRYEDMGRHVDVSILETQADTVDGRLSALVSYQYSGRVTPRGSILGAQYPAGTFPCADGYFRIASGGPRFSRAVEMMGNPPELLDPKWYTPQAPGDPALKEEFEAYFMEFTLQHTKRELFKMGQETGNLSAPFYSMDEVYDDPQYNERGFFTEVDHPMTGKVRYPGRPFIMEKTPWQLRRPAPLLGQHNWEVYSEMGYAKEDLVMLRETGTI